MADKNNIIVGSASLSIDGVDVGYTQGGITMRKSNEFVDIDADQLAGVARKVNTFERMFLSTTMLEVTRANMQKMFNEPTSSLTGSQLSFGSGSPTTTEYVLTVTGKAPGSSTTAVRTYTFYRAIPVDEVEHMIGSRDTPGVIPVGFELLKDDTHGNTFGWFYDHEP